MSQLINKSFSLAALLIHGAGQEVTPEKIKSIFDILKLEYSSKIASMFALSRDRYTAMLTSTGAAAPAAATSGVTAAVAAPEEEEVSEESSDNVLAF